MSSHPSGEADLVVRTTRTLVRSTLRTLVLIDRVAVRAGGGRHSLEDRARGLVPRPRRSEHEH